MRVQIRCVPIRTQEALIVELEGTEVGEEVN